MSLLARRFGGLWRHPDFVRLWSGQTVSIFGTLVSRTALPFTAILVLDVSAFQFALLSAADIMAQFTVGLVAGVWVDRLRKRPVMLAADVGRAALVASIPVAAWLGVLRVEHLFAVAFLTGALSICFDVAYQAYLPTLVRREELIEGNSKLTASASVAEFSAFGLGGWLVQWLTAPGAIVVDAVSFLVSALFVRAIRGPEPPPAPAAARQGMAREIAEGARAVLRDPVLRVLAVSGILQDTGFRITGAVFLLYVSRELGFSPGVLGLIFALGGFGSLAGALLAGRASRRFGVGPAMIIGLLLTGAGMLFVPAATGAGALALGLLIAQQWVTDPAATVFDINQVSIRQAVTPERLLGRVTAGIRFVGLGAMLLGALLGGLLAERIGLRATLVVGALPALLGAAWLIASPVRGLRDVDLGPGEAALAVADADRAESGTITEV